MRQLYSDGVRSPPVICREKPQRALARERVLRVSNGKGRTIWARILLPSPRSSARIFGIRAWCLGRRVPETTRKASQGQNMSRKSPCGRKASQTSMTWRKARTSPRNGKRICRHHDGNGEMASRSGRMSRREGPLRRPLGDGRSRLSMAFVESGSKRGACRERRKDGAVFSTDR